MKIEQIENKISIDNGNEQYTLSLSELKKQFQENKLRINDIHWNVQGSFIIFSALKFSYKYGSINKKILFDTKNGTFTQDNSCIHTAGNESEEIMATLLLNGRCYKILWDELRKNFCVPFFDANMIMYNSSDYVVHFKLCCGAKSFLFDFDMKAGVLDNYRTSENESIDTPPQNRQMLDYNFCMVRIKNKRKD